MKNMLSKVQEDMTVYDREGNKIGTVKAIQMGDEDLERPGAETSTAASAETTTDNTLVEDFARAISSDHDFPEEMKKRYMRYGYVKVDAGLLRSDRYFAADQIANVSGDRIELNVSMSDLVKN